VHLEFSNVTLLNVIDASQLVVESQAMAWKPHSHMFICWGFFVVNDGLLMDLMNLQMLWCIYVDLSNQPTMFWFKNVICAKV
jgi:hypothetical protein